MARFDPAHASLDFTKLKDSTIVLTGGASGIGAALVRLLHRHGANVVFGDVDVAGAQEVVSSTSPDSVHFVRTDVTVYADIITLFKTALTKFGRIDHAIANAGLLEQPGWFDPRLGIEGVETPPTMKTADVNFNGVLYFAHVACAYLSHGNESGKDKSLTLVGSVASFKETPGLFVYQAAKHAVLGLLRTLRLYLPKAFPGLRVNALCPSMTLTRMTDGIKDGWIGAGNPYNTPEDVARPIVAVCVAGPGTSAISFDEQESPGFRSRRRAGGMLWNEGVEQGSNGRALLVFGAKCYDIEEGLDRTEDLWLGHEISHQLAKGQAGLGDGTDWLK